MSWYDPETEKQYVAIQMGGSGWLRTGQRDDRLAVFAMEELDGRCCVQDRSDGFGQQPRGQNATANRIPEPSSVGFGC